MQQSAHFPARRWLPLGRLVLSTTGQYAVVLIGGTLLTVIQGVIFDHTIIHETPTAEALQEMSEALFIMAYGALYYSWPAAFVLLATLELLREYRSRWPVWQRWALLLAGITLGVLLPVLYAREAWSELIDLSFFWTANFCRAWILAAYVAIPWANRKYLRSSLPPA